MKRDDDPSNDDALFEREAAAVHLAHGGAADQELPRALARRIEADAVRHVQNAHAARRASTSAATSTTAAGAQVVVVEMPAPTPLRKLDVTRWTGWLAAAACAALFAAHAYRGRELEPKAASNASGFAQSGAQSASVYGVESSPDTELTWSDASQRGSLRIRALPPTDASSEYQIWLMRATDADRLPTPVGRFRVSLASTESTVALASPVAITAPDRLLVTREPLGGVLVSKHEHIVLEGQLGAR